jgi:hypothetical protein
MYTSLNKCDDDHCRVLHATAPDNAHERSQTTQNLAIDTVEFRLNVQFVLLISRKVFQHCTQESILLPFVIAMVTV